MSGSSSTVHIGQDSAATYQADGRFVAKTDDGATVVVGDLDTNIGAEWGNTVDDQFWKINEIFQGDDFADALALGAAQIGSSVLSVTGVTSITGRLDLGGASFGTSAGLRILNANYGTVWSDSNTDSASKGTRLGVAHYANSTEEPAAFAYVTSSSSVNAINVGGGTSLLNAATQIHWYTAANNTTTTGTLRGSITSAGLLDWVGNVDVGGTLDVTGDTTLTARLGVSGADPGTNTSEDVDDIVVGTGGPGTGNRGITVRAEVQNTAELRLCEDANATINGAIFRFDGSSNRARIGGLSSGGAFQEVIAFARDSQNLAFFAGTPVAKPTVTGSRGGNAALASLLTALANLNLLTDSSS